MVFLIVAIHLSTNEEWIQLTVNTYVLLQKDMTEFLESQVPFPIAEPSKARCILFLAASD